MIARADPSRVMPDAAGGRGSLPGGLEAIDAEIDAALADPLPTIRGHDLAGVATAGFAYRDDQATRLRSLVSEAGPDQPRALVEVAAEQPEPVLSPLTIAITSGKGGVGKTNIAVNLAAALAQLVAPGGRRYRVALLDADLGTANADVLCGLDPTARLNHVLTGDPGRFDGAVRSMRDIVVDAPGGFRLIPGSAGIARLADLLPADRAALFQGLASLNDALDALIIDTAAGIGASVTTFVDRADLCLVVTTPEPTAVADAYALIKCAAMSEHGRERWGGVGCAARFQLILNQCQDAAEARRTGARIGAVCDRFLGLNVPMLGWIAQDVRVAEAVRAREPFILRSPSCDASRNLWVLARAIAQQIGWTACEPAPRRADSHRRGGLASALRRLL